MKKILGLLIIVFPLLVISLGNKVKGEESSQTKEEVFWERIWPSESPVKTCNDSRGRPYPGTGPGAFTWFHWGGAGAWKAFTLDNINEPIFIRVSGDAHCINTLKFSILEEEDNKWVHKFKYDGPGYCYQGHPTPTDPGYRLIYYKPKSKRIKIEAESLYIQIHQAKKISPPTKDIPEELTKKIKGLITLLGDDDWETREKAHRELEKIGPPTELLLQEATKNNDPEIKVRATILLRKINQTKTPVQDSLDNQTFLANIEILAEHLFNQIVKPARLDSRSGGSEGKDQTNRARYEFQAMGNYTFPWLVNRFDKTDDSQTKITIIELMGQFQDPSVIPFLKKALADKTPEVAQSAQKLLEKLQK